MDKQHQDLNDAFRALAGHPVHRDEPEPPPRFAAGSGDGGKGGAPIRPPASTAELNKAMRDAAYRSRGHRPWEEVW